MFLKAKLPTLNDREAQSSVNPQEGLTVHQRPPISSRKKSGHLGRNTSLSGPGRPAAVLPSAAASPSSCGMSSTVGAVSEDSGCAEDQQLASHVAVLRLLEPGERLNVMYRCARIAGLDVHEGLLLFGRACFYLIDGYTLVNTREIVEIDALPSGVVHEPILPCISQLSTASTGSSAIPNTDEFVPGRGAMTWNTSSLRASRRWGASQVSGKQ
ncbi:unnamed protein product [Protopolystoma xenopodis]|uniref:BEACH-type PH domain-containing protein n=1 Tax=Protopolystoma xenopodis TaxID=117903 RepID=A0A3S5CJ03_9PLAT|nr:unnamed protein product [Protopolystoma xenopodis]